MSIQIRFSGSHVQDKIKVRAVKAKRKREHVQYHVTRAQAMREEAERIDLYLMQNGHNMTEHAQEEAERASTELKAQAIAEENGVCMEGSH